MTASSITLPFPARLRVPLQIDQALLIMTLALLFGGMVVLASASISISDNIENDPFFYVGRQAVAALLGGAATFAVLFIPLRVWSKLGPLMLLAGNTQGLPGKNIGFSALLLLIICIRKSDKGTVKALFLPPFGLGRNKVPASESICSQRMVAASFLRNPEKRTKRR